MAFKNVARSFGLQVKKLGNKTAPVLLKQGLDLAVPNVRCCAASAYGKGDSIFRQLLDYNTFTYTYLLADKDSKEAVLIDPVLQMVDRDIKLAEELGVRIVYGINTHMHADHITGTGLLRQRLKGFRSVISKHTSAKADVYIDDGHIIKFGKFQLECRSTPGHTDSCMTYVWHDRGMAFTGDALLIRGCGRTDFQQGSSSKLYESCHEKILSLPEDFLLFPCHDYNGRTVTTVGEEKKWNLRLTRSPEEFNQIMSNLKLAPPKFIGTGFPTTEDKGSELGLLPAVDRDEAVPANLNDGIVKDEKQKAT